MGKVEAAVGNHVYDLALYLQPAFYHQQPCPDDVAAVFFEYFFPEGDSWRYGGSFFNPTI